MAASETGLPHEQLILIYEYVPDILERRGEHREAHLAWLREWQTDGWLLAAGAFGNPPSGGLFLLAADADVQAMVDGDPYVKAGLVASWRIEPWTVTVR
ncbi:MAG TPA: YciI family protein [Solirubrobacteraceae bacterium]|nr:YciI family protein [Solirubrobacteraceae bacterium]